MKNNDLLKLIIALLLMVILGIAAATFDSGKGDHATCYDARLGTVSCE